MWEKDAQPSVSTRTTLSGIRIGVSDMGGRYTNKDTKDRSL